MNADQIGELMEGLGKAATAAAQVLALASTDQKNSALRAAAAAVRARRAAILAANERDMSAARAARLSGPRLERLRLDERRVEAIAESIDAVIELPDRIGERGVGAAERAQDPARGRATRRHRHHLREPSQRHRGRGRPVPEVWQRGDPAGRLRESALEPGAPRVSR